jgi:predicted secreted protein
MEDRMMKWYRISFLAGVLFMAMTDARADGPIQPSRTFHLDDSGSVVEIGEGQAMEVRLEARLGTGYAWTVTRYDDSVLKLVGERTEADATGKLGGPEVQVFTFEASGPGHTNLVMRYARPWEATEKGEMFHLDVHVVAS